MNTKHHLYFSYIIFSPSTASFTSFGGYINKDHFFGSEYMDIKKIIYRTENLLFGFTSLSISTKDNQNVSIAIDGDLIMSCQS